MLTAALFTIARTWKQPGYPCQCCLLAGLHRKPLQQVGRKSVEDFLSIRKALGLSIPEGQPLYNTQTFAGYRMRRVGK